MTTSHFNYHVILFSFAVTAVFGNSVALLAQDTAPPSDINGYISTRKSIANKIVADLEGRKDLAARWPREHTDKLLNALDKLQAKYKRSSDPKQGTDTSRTWSDWVAKEILLWEHIELQLNAFGQLHRDLFVANKDVKKEISDNRELVRQFNPVIEKMDLLLERGADTVLIVDKYNRLFSTAKKFVFFGQTLDHNPPSAEDLLKTLSPQETKFSHMQVEACLVQLKSLYYTLFKSSEFKYMNNVFTRELPYKHLNLKKQTASLYSDIEAFENTGEKVVKKQLVKYNSLKRAGDVNFYKKFDNDCDEAMEDKISLHTKIRVEWEVMVKEYLSSVMPPHIRKKMKPDFSNADDVIDEMENLAEQIEDIDELYSSLQEALKKINQ